MKKVLYEKAKNEKATAQKLFDNEGLQEIIMSSQKALLHFQKALSHLDVVDFMDSYVSSVGKENGGKTRRDRAAKSDRRNVMGRKNGEHPQCCYRDREQQIDLCIKQAEQRFL